jgi:hypothetical protein
MTEVRREKPWSGVALFMTIKHWENRESKTELRMD